MIKLFLLPLLATLSAQVPDRGAHQLQLETPDGTLLYGISIPRGYEPGKPRPLILALHPGGERMPYYGNAFMRQIVAPALNGLDAIIIAPDCPTRAWSDPIADRSVMALIEHTMEHYSIDRRRILVVGFSLGGRGTWYFATHHSDLFTGAIPMAASTGDDSQERMGTIPTYIIHSRIDEVVPFDPAERNARELEKLGRNVHFEPLEGPGHFQMGGYIDALRKAGRWIAERWPKESAPRP
jgi:predicted peptidase